MKRELVWVFLKGSCGTNRFMRDVFARTFVLVTADFCERDALESLNYRRDIMVLGSSTPSCLLCLPR